MEETSLKRKLEEAVWICRSLFSRGKTSGSTANLSFRDGDEIYITRSGSCFGTMTEEDFAVVPLSGEADVVRGGEAGNCGSGSGSSSGCLSSSPSKEFPLHLMLYRKDPEIQAVIHTHGPFAVLVSCLPPRNEGDVVPSYTPYLRMKVGRVVWVPYAPPGSQALFGMAEERAGDARAFLLANHGAVVGGTSLMEAFYGLEELEESCRVYWELKDLGLPEIP